MATTKWSIDPTHSEIGFKVKHMMFTNVSGKFEQYDASIETNDDDFTTGNFAFSADISSIDTRNEDRNNHLKSADFFDAEKFSTIEFKSTSVEKDGDDYIVKGDLTIKDVTKAVKLNAEFGGIATDPWGNTKAGFTFEGKIKRSDFGLNWNAALETGGVLVGEEVKLIIDLQLVKS